MIITPHIFTTTMALIFARNIAVVMGIWIAKVIRTTTTYIAYFIYRYILRSSSFCEIWALCVSWITYDHLYCAPCLAFWALFGSLAPVRCSRTSCAQGHIVFMTSYIRIYYAHLASVRFEHSVCRGSLMTTYIY